MYSYRVEGVKTAKSHFLNMTKNTIQVSGNKATMFVHQISPALIVFDVPESTYFVVIVAAALCINIDK